MSTGLASLKAQMDHRMKAFHGKSSQKKGSDDSEDDDEDSESEDDSD